jgi:hypothetical protein
VGNRLRLSDRSQLTNDDARRIAMNIAKLPELRSQLGTKVILQLACVGETAVPRVVVC